MMNFGLIVSIYDEIDETTETIKTFKENQFPIIVIQSDPNNPKKIINSNSVNYYELFSDFAGSKDQYVQERIDTKGSTTPTKALTRNFSKAFSVAKNFDVDWWITICGDVVINNFNGIEKIIQKMIIENKSLGITKAVGQVFFDKDDNLSRIQDPDTTDFMPQFFIINQKLIQKGLFNNILITNPFTTEQCMGDDVNRFCAKNNISFADISYVIADYAYPQFIDGLLYNPDRIIMPRYIDSIVNKFRKLKFSFSK